MSFFQHVSGLTTPKTNLSPPVALLSEPATQSYELVSSSSALPPNAHQLQALTHLPSGMMRGLQSRQSKNRRGRKNRKGKLVKDAAIVSKLFNDVASRPYPVNKMNLEQQISVELTFTSNPVITSSVTVPIYGGAFFTLNNFSASTQLVTVFDQYRFRQVEVWLEPTAAQGTTVFAPIATAIDLDDANTPTSFGIVSDKPGAIVSQGGAGHYHKWLPHVAIATYSGAFTSFSNEPAMWLDCASPAIQHYGLKFALMVTPVAIPYVLTVRAIIQFRAPAIS